MNRPMPIIKTDYPDPDIIRVGDTYYMISTTMHFMPGGVILRSFDLKNWEIASYVYDTLEETGQEKMEGESSIYGKGMWAASLRFHRGVFHVLFSVPDSGTYRRSVCRALGAGKGWRRGIFTTPLFCLMMTGGSILPTVSRIYG